MKILYPLRILHIPRERILVAAVTIAGGHKIEVVRVTGEDFKVDVAEARRLATALLGILRNDYEIEVEAFAGAVAFESKAKQASVRASQGPDVFLHRSCVPLGQVDFSTDVDRGQGLLDGFNNECEGMCGV